MKKLNLCVILLVLLFIATPSFVRGNEESSSAKNTEAVAEAKAEIAKMVNRVKEINEMDFETLSRKERKELKKELRGIKTEFKEYSKSENPAVAQAAGEAISGGGIYISGGALLIIIILLILL